MMYPGFYSSGSSQGMGAKPRCLGTGVSVIIRPWGRKIRSYWRYFPSAWGDGLMVYGHFGPKTLRTQDISAVCVWCRNVSHFCIGSEVDTSAPVPKCLGQFGTKVHKTLRTQN